MLFRRSPVIRCRHGGLEKNDIFDSVSLQYSPTPLDEDSLIDNIVGKYVKSILFTCRRRIE